MTKSIPFLQDGRNATVKKSVDEERECGSRTRRLFAKILPKNIYLVLLGKISSILFAAISLVISAVITSDGGSKS